MMTERPNIWFVLLSHLARNAWRLAIAATMLHVWGWI